MAYQNMRFIDVTLDVFHAPRSSLKAVEKWNNCSMSVTSAVSHAEMGPYAASAAARSDSHAATAVRIVVLSIAGRCRRARALRRKVAWLSTSGAASRRRRAGGRAEAGGSFLRPVRSQGLLQALYVVHTERPA